MALTDDNGSGMVMPVAPMYGGGYGNGNGFGFGGDGWWIILLFIILGGWGGYGNGGFGGNIGGEIYPWMNQANLTSEGFQNQLMNDSITSIRDGVFGISTQLCNGFAGVNATVANGFAQAEIANNARQIADMQQNFALQSSLADCCCENRLGIADLKYTVATENCADRTQSLMNTRDIIESQTRGTQAVLDKLCQLELDGVKGQLAAAERENLGLQNALNMASFRESQTAQNALITQGFSNEVDALYNRLNSCPVPTTPVYGRTPIFTCNNGGCGCGNNVNF